MTDSVKFPLTDKWAPSAVYLRDISKPTAQPKLAHSLLPSDYSLKYLRSDTATPNDQVVEMMREAFIRGMYHYDDFPDAIGEDDADAVIAEIRSRYAASDSD